MGWRGTRLRTEGHETERAPFDALRCAAEIKSLIEEMTSLDPRGGCWEWVRENLVEKWASFLAEMKRIDAAFERQAAEELVTAITSVRRVYRECIESWERRRGENVKETR